VKFTTRAFAGVVGDRLNVAGAPPQAGDRSDIDDAAVLVRNHRSLPDFPTEQKNRADIQIHHLIPSLDRVILRRRSPRGARVVDENVHLSELRNRLVRKPLDVIVFGIVCRDPIRPDAETGKVPLGLVEIRGLPR
jgi:hypothetical protein